MSDNESNPLVEGIVLLVLIGWITDFFKWLFRVLLMGLAIVVGVPVALVAAVVVLSFVGGVLAGLFWPQWTVWMHRTPDAASRIADGVRVAAFHWPGAWWRGWVATCQESDRKRRQNRLENRSGASSGWDLFWHAIHGVAWAAGMWTGNALAMLLHLVVIGLGTVLWLPWAALVGCLKTAGRIGRDVRECRDCHGWTVEPMWRCPKCGALHSGLEPSAKYGMLRWHCACGCPLPTMDVLGRTQLEEACPECGGKLDRIGRAPAGVAFLGGMDSGKTWLWRESVPALAEGLLDRKGWKVQVSAGTRVQIAALGAVSWKGIGPEAEREITVGLSFRYGAGPWRTLRVHDVPGHSFKDARALVRQRHWDHAGAVVFAMDPADPGPAERVFDRWVMVMDREHPGRVRRMACAVALMKADGPAGLANARPTPGMEDAQCRAFLARSGAGNLLNGLDGRFRKVRVFALGMDGLADLWNWTLGQAFRPHALSLRKACRRRQW